VLPTISLEIAVDRTLVRDRLRELGLDAKMGALLFESLFGLRDAESQERSRP
jgi:hypothetical protein